MDTAEQIQRPRTKAEWHEAVERNRLKLLRIVCGLLVLARWVFPFASKAAMGGAPIASLSLFQRLAVSLILRTLWKAELATQYLVFVVASLRGSKLSPPPAGGGGSRSKRSAADAVGEWLMLAPTRSEPLCGPLACLPRLREEAEALDPANLFARLIALKEALEDLVAAAELQSRSRKETHLSDRHSGAATLNPESRAERLASPDVRFNAAFCLPTKLDSGSHKCVRNDDSINVDLQAQGGELFLIPP